MDANLIQIFMPLHNCPKSNVIEILYRQAGKITSRGGQNLRKADEFG